MSQSNKHFLSANDSDRVSVTTHVMRALDKCEAAMQRVGYGMSKVPVRAEWGKLVRGIKQARDTGEFFYEFSMYTLSSGTAALYSELFCSILHETGYVAFPVPQHNEIVLFVSWADGGHSLIQNPDEYADKKIQEFEGVWGEKGVIDVTRKYA